MPGVFDDPSGQGIPVLPAERAADVTDVEPLLDVYGQAVAQYGHNAPECYPSADWTRVESMNSTMVRTLRSTRWPICSSLTTTPNVRWSSRTISSASMESSPRP